VVLATVFVTFVAMQIGGEAFGVPCSSGFNYWPLIAVYPFVALLGVFEIVAPGFALFLALVQYPAYGFFIGRAWVTRKPLMAILVVAMHVLAVIVAVIKLKAYL
jgi:hypothetical protein